MKIRHAQNRKLTSTKAKGAVCGILLLALAFAIPGVVNSQDKAAVSKSSPQPALASLPGAVPVGNAPKEVSGLTAAKTLPAAMITDVRIAPEDGKATVTVSTDRLLAPQEFLLDNPRRLVLDFPNTENRVKTARLPVNAASVKQIRVQQFQASPSPIARMVFDLEEDSGAHEMIVDKSLISLVFYKGRGKSEPAPPAAAAAAAAAKRDAKAVVPAADEVSRSPEPPSRSLPAQAAPAPQPTESVPALIAALTPAAIAAPKMIATSTSRFSGQPLTFDLVDFPLVDFFRLMAEEGGINIVLDPAVKGNLSMKVVKLPWDHVFEAALANNNLDKQVEGTLVRVARKSTLQEEARQQEALKKANLLAADLETRIKRLNYAKAASLIGAVADQKTVRGTVVVDERTNSLILTDLPSSIAKQIQLIETLDIPQPQVEIEARIVSATRDFARDIGIQFGFVDGNLQRVTVGGPNTYGTIGGTRPSATPNSGYAAGNPLTGRGASESTTSESAAISTGVSSNEKGNYNVNLPAGRAFGGLGISIGNIFDTFLLDAAITAGESKGWAKLISQPKVTAQNNSPAVITQGLRFPVPVNANNTVTIQFFNAALTLTVTPQITLEGNIVLDLRVENNTPDFGRQVMAVPSIRTSESSTRVLVSDGGTTVIGGILMDDEANSEDKVPGLGSLPLIGNLFRRTSVSRSTQEVLFFVTPRIVK